MVMPHTVTTVMPNLVTPHGYVTYGHVGYAIYGYSTWLRRLRQIRLRHVWLCRLRQTHLWHVADRTGSLLRTKLYKR